MIAAALVLAAAGLLAACDGYPTEDAPLLDERASSVPQLLQALDGVGARPHLGVRHRYALQPGCVLEVVSDDGSALETLRVPLAGADITTRVVDGPSPSHEVLVVAAGLPPEAREVVLQGGRWVDWVQTRSLLQQLQLRCADEAAPSPPRSPSDSDPH